jgi:hypothetical protein
VTRLDPRLSIRRRQPEGSPPIAPQWSEFVRAVLLPTNGYAAPLSDTPVIVGTGNTITAAPGGQVFANNAGTGLIRSQFRNEFLTQTNSVSVGLLVSFRLAPSPTGQLAIAGLGANSGAVGNTLFMAGVSAAGAIGGLTGTSSTNDVWTFTSVLATDGQPHTIFLEGNVSASGVTFSRRYSVDGVAQISASFATGAQMPYEHLCVNGTRRTTDINGESKAQVLMAAAFVFPADGEYKLSAQQALDLSGNPWQIYEPQRIWVPFSAPSSGVTLTGNSAAQSNTSTNGGVTQTHVLTGASASQANASTSAPIAQTHILLGANAAQPNTSTSGAISQAGDLTGNNVAQPNTSSSGAVTQTHILVGANASQQNTFTSGSISTGTVIVGGHYGAWWLKKWEQQFAKPEELPTLEEVVEFVEGQPAEAVKALKATAPKMAAGISAKKLTNNAALLESVAKQLLISIKLRQIELIEEDDMEVLFLS